MLQLPLVSPTIGIEISLIRPVLSSGFRIHARPSKSVKTQLQYVPMCFCMCVYMCVSKALWSYVRPTPTPHTEFLTFLQEEITALWEHSPACSWHMVAK